MGSPRRTRLGRWTNRLPWLTCYNCWTQGTSWSRLESIVTAVNPNWRQLPSFKRYRCMFLVEYCGPLPSMTSGRSFRVWVWMGAGSQPICWSSQFVGLLFAPTVTLPCTCSSDRGWCGVGPPGRKYKPLSFRCLADKSCGGPAAPCFRHVPPTPQWGVFC